MQIGEIKLDAPLVLAPMAGITDLPFRVICRRLGCGMTVSEMVSAKGLLYKNVKTTEMLRIDAGERPTAIQLFGSVPAELAEAAKMVGASGADIIDFNMGCPVPKIVNNGEGSALMKKPQLAYEVLATMVDAVRIPVTVKFRAGWDEEHRNALEIALAAEHLDMLIAFKGEHISVKEMRRHISAYLKGLPHAAEFRGRFHKVDTREEFRQLLAEYRQCARNYYEHEKHFAAAIVEKR